MKKILFITCHIPLPATSGGRRREFEIIKRISKEFEVILFSICKTNENFNEGIALMKEFCSQVKIFKADGNTLAQTDSSLNLPQQILKNYSSEAVSEICRIIEEGQIDLIHLEGFYMSYLLPVNVSIPVILVEQNIEYKIWEQKHNFSEKESEKKYYKIQYEFLKEKEKESLEIASRCICLTTEDYEDLIKIIPPNKIRLIPNGYDHLPSLICHKGAKNDYSETKNFLAGFDEKEKIILFTGNYDYEPNVDSVFYLCREIFPFIREKAPKVNLFLVGNDPDQRLKELVEIPNVYVTGKVASLVPYLDRADIFVCPLRFGGGVKVKMLEAIARNKPIVSSSIGVQGIHLDNNGSILVENNPKKFAEKVLMLLENEKFRSKKQTKTKNLLSKMYSWDEIAGMTVKIYNELI
jgi:polysaccharide biosynthesis protein PslH